MSNTAKSKKKKHTGTFDFVFAITLISFVISIICSFCGTWTSRMTSSVVGCVLCIVVLVFVWLHVCIALNKYRCKRETGMYATCIIGAVMIFGIAFLLIAPTSAYECQYRVRGPFTVIDKFMAEDDYTYVAVTTRNGKVAWLKVTSENSRVEVGDIIEGSYVEGKASNDDGEYYEKDFEVISIRDGDR